jgi:small subunit ribosomal protein S9
LPEEAKPEAGNTEQAQKQEAVPEVKETTESGAAEAEPKPKPKARTAKVKHGKSYFWGTGRRKTSVARVRICPGSGVFQINGRELQDYFGVERLRQQAASALEVTNMVKKIDVFVNVNGGGPTGQTGATILGLARALIKMDEGLAPALRSRGFMTRDARKVERKKYGRAGARKSFQFSKR